MKRTILAAMVLTLLWVGGAQAKLTLGVVSSGTGSVSSEAQAESLAKYLEERLGEQVKVRVFKDEPTLHSWMHRFRVVDLGVFSNAYLKGQPAGQLLELGGLSAATGHRQSSLALRQGVGKHVQSRLEDVLSGMDRDPRLLQNLAAGKIQPPQEARPASVTRQKAQQTTLAKPPASVPRQTSSFAALTKPKQLSAPVVAGSSAVAAASSGALRVGLIDEASSIAVAPSRAVSASAPRPVVKQDPVQPVQPKSPPIARPLPEPAVSVETAEKVATRPVVSQPPVTAKPPAVVAKPVQVDRPVEIAKAPAVPVPAPKAAEKPSEPLKQVARLAPPSAPTSLPPPPVAKPKLTPAPEPPPATSVPSVVELETIFVAPFLTIMVPDAVADGIFDGFVDALIEEGEEQGYEFTILKKGLDKVDPGWLAQRGYITGEVFAYVEDSGCCSTNIRSKSRVRLYSPGQSEPEAEFEFPAKVFFDHDYSTLEKERSKLAARISRELADRLLQSLRPLAARAGR